MNWKPKITLINLTVLFLVIFLVDAIWFALRVNNGFIFISLFLTTPLFALAVLFFVNLGFAVDRPKQRMAHIMMSLLIVILVFGVFPLCIRWHLNTQHHWFFQEGMRLYEPMVEKILQQRAALKDKNTSLDTLVDHPHVWGHTNADGSITIRFAGRGNYLRAGYIFYSGIKITIEPGNTGRYCIADYDGVTNEYVHLTNGWYEY
jgi:hypothetical protein